MLLVQETRSRKTNNLGRKTHLTEGGFHSGPRDSIRLAQETLTRPVSSLAPRPVNDTGLPAIWIESQPFTPDRRRVILQSQSQNPTTAPTTTTHPTAPPTSIPTAPPTSIPTAPPTSIPTASPTSIPTAPPPVSQRRPPPKTQPALYQCPNGASTSSISNGAHQQYPKRRPHQYPNGAPHHKPNGAPHHKPNSKPHVDSNALPDGSKWK
ncbi:hypothetical protein CYMTET_36754 [Cymbomonas tetramitiformis]|uniref:Uncharacterized protein n=1 Tax=Cymbomonas tetramitiformis TaxID=36881 RepID=A0AAE0F6P0_9CHLO|nr:hypothetical protein CYMTET_36754 [Cymbomonas tetramitiformis]